MHEPKPLTANQLLQQACPADLQYKRVNWHNMQLSVRPFLDIKEVMALIDMAVGMVINHEHKVFAPELTEYAIRAGVVGYYAAVEMPDTLEEQYRILMTTDLYDVVCKNINQAQLGSIKDAVLMCLKVSARI